MYDNGGRRESDCGGTVEVSETRLQHILCQLASGDWELSLRNEDGIQALVHELATNQNFNLAQYVTKTQARRLMGQIVNRLSRVEAILAFKGAGISSGKYYIPQEYSNGKDIPGDLPSKVAGGWLIVDGHRKIAVNQLCATNPVPPAMASADYPRPMLAKQREKVLEAIGVAGVATERFPSVEDYVAAEIDQAVKEGKAVIEVAAGEFKRMPVEFRGRIEVHHQDLKAAIKALRRLLSKSREWVEEPALYVPSLHQRTHPKPRSALEVYFDQRRIEWAQPTNQSTTGEGWMTRGSQKIAPLNEITAHYVGKSRVLQKDGSRGRLETHNKQVRKWLLKSKKILTKQTKNGSEWAEDAQLFPDLRAACNDPSPTVDKVMDLARDLGKGGLVRSNRPPKGLPWPDDSRNRSLSVEVYDALLTADSNKRTRAASVKPRPARRYITGKKLLASYDIKLPTRKEREFTKFYNKYRYRKGKETEIVSIADKCGCFGLAAMVLRAGLQKNATLTERRLVVLSLAQRIDDHIDEVIAIRSADEHVQDCKDKAKPVLESELENRRGRLSPEAKSLVANRKLGELLRTCVLNELANLPRNNQN